MALPDYPITRNEHYLARIAGQEVELPEYPITREEKYLAEIAEHGDGGTIEETTGILKGDGNGNAVAAETEEAESIGIDTEVTEDSANLVTSGAVYDFSVRSVNEKTGDVVLTPADLGIGTVFQLKGSKATVADLPSSGNTIGDVWYVVAESVGYIWLNDGTTDRWEQLGLPIDLSAYSTTAQMNAAIAAAIAAIPTKAMVVTYDDDTTETFNVLISE